MKIKSLRALVWSLVIVVSTASAAPSEQQVELRTATGTLAGSLMMPEGAAKGPVVLLIAGSGPTDRDGNSAGLPGANNSLLMVARGLADAGIASLRYDKRGIAASRAAATNEENMRFEQLIDDAAGWVKMLADDSRFTSVAIAGHSEGSLVGMAAAQTGKVNAFISLAGAGRGVAEVLRSQLAGKLSGEALALAERILSSLERGEAVADVPPGFATLFRPSVQPYLISVFKYRPAEQIARLSIPVLIVQGSTDIQVSVGDAEALKKAKPDAQLLIVQGMNHVLKTVSGTVQEQLPSYSNPALPLAPALMPAMVEFLRKAR